MKETLIDLDQFLELRKGIPILDARSEGEFAQGHVIGAINIPILNDSERKEVGTLYKQKGNQEAAIKGFELVGPRFHKIIKEALLLFPDKKILIYCWRGGMRSEIMSWILNLSGFEIYRLKGGYKTYRNFTFNTVRTKRNFLVLGGKTGTGKTIFLSNLKKLGESVIDLEGIANHKGSSFGGISQPQQPSNEHFENLLAEELVQIPISERIWIENESQRIGKVNLAIEFFSNLVDSTLIEISKSESERIAHIEAEYAHLPKKELTNAVLRLQKRLGGKRTSDAIEAIHNDNNESWIRIMLEYYDKAYTHDLKVHQRPQTIELNLENLNIDQAVKLLLSITKNYNGKFPYQIDPIQ